MTQSDTRYTLRTSLIVWAFALIALTLLLVGTPDHALANDASRADETIDSGEPIAAYDETGDALPHDKQTESNASAPIETEENNDSASQAMTPLEPDSIEHGQATDSDNADELIDEPAVTADYAIGSPDEDTENPADTPTAHDVIVGETESDEIIVPGDYIIRTALADRSVLDVNGGSSANGANVQIYAYNGSNAQKWHIAETSEGSGLYTIASFVSGKVLDIAGAATWNGANVQMWESNGTKAQQWRIVAEGSNWRIISALKSDFVLDIAGGSSSNGTNAHAWSSNGTTAQLFNLIALKPDVSPSTVTLADGAYTITNSASSKVLDISGGSQASGGNVQQWEANNTYAQRFYLQRDENGYYRVFNIGSGLALDVSGADVMPGANVQQWAYNGSDAQLWSLQSATGGAYTLISKANGLALDIAGASRNNGANLQTYTPNGTNAQSFGLKKVSLLIGNSSHSFRSVASTSLAIDVAGASKSENAALQLYAYNGTMAQKLIATPSSSGSDTNEMYLSTLCADKYVNEHDGAIVQASAKTPWTLAYSTSGERRGIVFLASDGKAVSVSSAKSGSPLKLAALTGAQTQAFIPVLVGLIENGTYKIVNVGSNKVLDVASGSWSNGANIQQWTSNDSGAQAFVVEDAGNGYYRISNAMTGRALDVAGAQNFNGANVQQYQKNGTDAQLWKALYQNGHYVFVNKATNNALDVSGASKHDGANVDIWDQNGTVAQQWNLIATTYTPDAVLQEAIDRIGNLSSDTNYIIAVDRAHTRTIVFEGSAGNWTPIQNWVVSVGAPWSPTVTGHYTVGIRGYSFGHGYTAYYYTQFWGDYLFHSVLYNEGTFDIQDGRLGYQISQGCVRMNINDAKWIYDNIPAYTHVYVYN